MARDSVALLRLKPDHPCRPPHWRWERARKLREMTKRLPTTGREDSWVIRCAQLQKKLDNAKDEVDRCIAYDEAGPLGIAYDIWDDPGVMNGSKAEIEARILVGQPSDEIAQRLATSIEVIDAYESVFFNVRDRLENVGYITHQALGEKIYKRMLDNDYPTMIKMFAYFTQAPIVVDALLTTFPNTSRSTPVTDINSFFTNDTKWSMARKSALAARMLALDNMSQLQLLEMVTRIEEATGGAGNPANQNFLENVKALMGHIHVEFDPNAAKSGSGLELRAEEQILLAKGKPVPALETTQQFKFPEIEKK